MPTTMNAVALKAPWASSIVQPAIVVALVPQPNTAIMKPSWLIVPSARSSLRSVRRSARMPPTIIVATPTVTTTGRHHSVVRA
jgi:hypothetical protein